jgi:hypothetical protein
MLRKTMIALLAVVLIGLSAPTVASARGGFGGFGGHGFGGQVDSTAALAEEVGAAVGGEAVGADRLSALWVLAWASDSPGPTAAGATHTTHPMATAGVTSCGNGYGLHTVGVCGQFKSAITEPRVATPHMQRGFALRFACPLGEDSFIFSSRRSLVDGLSRGGVWPAGYCGSR